MCRNNRRLILPHAPISMLLRNSSRLPSSPSACPPPAPRAPPTCPALMPTATPRGGVAAGGGAVLPRTEVGGDPEEEGGGDDAGGGARGASQHRPEELPVQMRMAPAAAHALAASCMPCVKATCVAATIMVGRGVLLCMAACAAEGGGMVFSSPGYALLRYLRPLPACTLGACGRQG